MVNYFKFILLGLLILLLTIIPGSLRISIELFLRYLELIWVEAQLLILNTVEQIGIQGECLVIKLSTDGAVSCQSLLMPKENKSQVEPAVEPKEPSEAEEPKKVGTLAEGEERVVELK